MNIKEIEYKNFGRCLEMSNDTVSLVVTLDFGPRIISYRLKGGENVFWEDDERIIFDESVTEFYQSPWYLYGGHRLWVAPEEFPKTYYADNEPVCYKEEDGCLVFTAPVQKLNGFECGISLSLDEFSSDVKVRHILTNKSDKEIKAALWGVSVLLGGGNEFIPIPVSDNVHTPNKLIAFWPRSKMFDERMSFSERYIRLRHDEKEERSLKFGINPNYPFAFYQNGENIFIKKYDYQECGCYTDYGMTLESYANKYYVEMESLGQYVSLLSGQSTCHTEYWSIEKSSLLESFDDESIDRFVGKYILNS